MAFDLLIKIVFHRVMMTTVYLSITYLKVSRIIVKRTNLPRSGTTSDVGGMISASKRKNTVSDNRIEMDRLTYERQKQIFLVYHDVIALSRENVENLTDNKPYIKSILLFSRHFLNIKNIISKMEIL